ncbi:TPA: hypothetical protein SAQ65_002578 [Bacillus cereus]|nr:hypothetical protein [Bacillus cereus]
MANSVWKFVKGHNDEKNEVTEAVIGMISTIFNFMRDELKTNYEYYNDLEQMVKIQLDTKKDNCSYFWDWMDNHGLNLINSLVNTPFLENDEELLDLLDYRIYILEADIESGILDNTFSSIAETLTSIVEYTKAKYEIASTKSTDIIEVGWETLSNFIENISYETDIFTESSEDWAPLYAELNNSLAQEMYTYSENTYKQDIKIQWNLENPAEFQQDFCYYFTRRDENHGPSISDI